MQVLTATPATKRSTRRSTPDLAIVLMDIMMLKWTAISDAVIRANPEFGRVPIIALTAKAMKGDREKCLDAGASDSLAKRSTPNAAVRLADVGCTARQIR